ncbi:anti-sigma factor family protein [Sorangium sp. So ce131]|uniref:anti-sigma factor family protein n=1 Tax=Sorangium sp. So ce131 TaxID=3133282 RepID=UPI003F615AAD
MNVAIPADLDCDELVEVVTDYLEGALSPEERTRFEHHLVYCPPCATYLRQVRDTRRLVAELRSPGPTEAKSALLAAFRACQRGPIGPGEPT